MKLRSVIAAVLGCCALVSPALAWNATGHKTVAFIAWEDLTPATKAAVTAILQQHPRYEKDLLLDAPADQSPQDRARTAFATAATWPDMVRSQANPMSATHNHPAWHFIDIPYVTGNVKAEPRPQEGKGPHDCVEALIQCNAELKDPAISAGEKAVDLCWIEHLTGDVHQPLHAISWYSPAFPHGDQGGNAEMILKSPPYPDSAIKLHSLWDGLAGDFQSEAFPRIEAAGLRNDPHYFRERFKDQLTVTDFMAWANESHELAIEYVYLKGTIQTAPARRHFDDGDDAPQVPAAPAGYLAAAERIAMDRITLAGYRLADELNRTFDPK